MTYIYQRYRKHRWQNELREFLVQGLCRFWLGWDGWKTFPVKNKVLQVMIVTASGEEYVSNLGPVVQLFEL